MRFVSAALMAIAPALGAQALPIRTAATDAWTAGAIGAALLLLPVLLKAAKNR